MSGKIKILVVEDDIRQATLMIQILSQAGCAVQAVHTGKKGIELAVENQFDLIALDVRLPDMNGFEICKELKQRHVSRNTPVVFISGDSGENVQRSFMAGATDFIQKPFNASEFATRLLAHLKFVPPENAHAR